MNLYEQKGNNYRSKPACGYCREQGHNQYECPRAAEDWHYFKDFIVPVQFTKTNVRYYKSPKYWGEWYEKCQNLVAEQERRKNVKKTRPSTPRSKPKCGFCGSEGHNRRKCDVMKQFVAKCKLANEKYRTEVHDYIVKGLGLDVGAAVSLTRDNYYDNDEDRDSIGLITEINWDKVNVMTGFKTGWDTRQYGQKIQVKALVNGREEFLALSKLITADSCHLIKNYDNGYYHHHITKILGKSEVPLPEEWTVSYGEAWDYLVKKCSYERLRLDGVLRHIDEWANK